MPTALNPWAPFERHRTVTKRRPPKPPDELELASIAAAVEGLPEGKAILRRIESGNTVDPAEVFSFLPAIAPDGWKCDPDAAERMESKLALDLMADDWDETKGLDELTATAQRADRFRTRWERTFANILTRHWERRRTVVIAKTRSAQFRKGTPLWDPPGDTPLVDRLGILVDEEAWDAELRAELTGALRDLRLEAREELDILSGKDDQEWPEWISRWIAHALTFNRKAARAIRRVLAAEPTRVEDIERQVNEHVTRTMSFVGDSVSTSLATGAIGEAQYDDAKAAGAVERMWYSAHDGRVRPQHRHANLQRVPIGKPFKVRDRNGTEWDMRFPGDPDVPPDLWMNCRCLVGGTEVSANVTAAMVRSYRGVLVEFTTAGGHKLSATPEHPVLTRRGWITAGALDPSDEVFCRTLADGASSGPDVGDRPPTIEQVYDALAEASTRGEGLHVAGVNFKGNVPDGEVDVVWAEGVLPFGPDAELLEHLGQLGIASTHGEVGLTGNETALDWIAHTDQRSFAAPAHIESEVAEAEGDGAALDFEASGHTQHALAGAMAGPDVFEQSGAALDRGGADGVDTGAYDASVRELAVHGGEVRADGVGNLLESHAAQIQAFPLVDLSFREWSGHVYDLTTQEHAFLAGGIVTHNCVALYITPLSRRLWLDREDQPYDPYGRRTMAEAKHLDLGALGIETKFVGARRRKQRLMRARDADGDGMVQEGTPFERPASPVQALNVGPSLSQLLTASTDQHAMGGGADGELTAFIGPDGGVLVKEFKNDESMVDREVAVASFAALLGVNAPRVERYNNAIIADLFQKPDGNPAMTLVEYAEQRAREEVGPAPEGVGDDFYKWQARYNSVGRSIFHEVATSEAGRKIGLMDFLIQNLDRHEANVVMVDGEPYAIDHSRSLHTKGIAVPSGTFDSAWIEPRDSYEILNGVKTFRTHFSADDLREAAEAIDELEKLPAELRPPKEQIKEMRHRLTLLLPEGETAPELSRMAKVRKRLARKDDLLLAQPAAD